MPTEPPPPIPTGIPLFVAWVFVVQAVIVTYDGWYGAFYFGDEMINPGVEIPRSMINGVLLLSAIYIFTNAALFYVFDAPTLARENLPIAAVGQMILGERGPVIVRSFMTITLVSVANASVLCATRILYAMSRDGWGSVRIAYVNRGGTPTIPLFLSAFATVGFLLSGSFDRVLAITAFFYVSKYLLSYLAVFILRRRAVHATPLPCLRVSPYHCCRRPRFVRLSFRCYCWRHTQQPLRMSGSHRQLPGLPFGSEECRQPPSACQGPVGSGD